MHIWIIAFAILLFSHRDATAQGENTIDHKMERADLTPPLPIDRITEELPPGNVRAIAQDGTGFVWIGTEEGLARFDGHEFVNYSGKDAKSGFTERFVSSMATDIDGRLWVGTGVGLFVYDPGKDKFSVFDLGDSPGDSISTLLADSKGRLWVGYSTGGRSMLEGGTWTHVVDDVVPTRFRESKAGYWLATEQSGVTLLANIDKPIKSYSLIEGSFKGDDKKKYLHSSSISDLLVEKDTYLWIATADAGLDRLEIATGEVKHYDKTSSRSSIISDNLRTLAMDHNGELWIGADDGLSLYQAASDDFLRFQTEVRDPKSLGFNFVTSSFVDASGVLWLGQFARGISKFHPDARHTRLYQSYLTGGQNPTSFALGADDVMWVGTYNGGLWAFDFKKGTRTGYYLLRDGTNEVDLANNWITSMLPEGEGLWLTTNNAGLVFFHPPSGRFQSFNTENSEIASNSLESIVKDQSGMLWMGSIEEGVGGVLRLNPADGTWDAWDSTQLPLPSPDVFALRFDDNGEDLWVGTSDGLLKLNLASSSGPVFESVEDDPETLPGRQIFALLQVGTTMWVATTDGLGQLDIKTGKVRRWMEADGLSNQTVYGLLEAGGLIWLTTNGGGLQSLDPETGTFTTFLGGDGMQGREYSSGAYLKTPDGTLVFGGHEGYNMFKPSNLNRAIDIGPVVLTAVDVANKPFSFKGASWNSKNVSMEHASGIVKFSFAALGFASPELVHYQYRLKGFQKEWQLASPGQRSATYTNLDHGDYRFEIKAQDRQGKWSEATSIKLHVEPPVYKTWWAYLIYAAIFCVAVLGYLKYQRAKLSSLQQQNRLLSVEKDLELTGAVQTGFLPADAGVSAEAFSLLGFYRPAESCSGDWWWHEAQPNGYYTVLVGDVTGHGPGPAMVTAAVATAYRVQSQFSGSMEDRLRVINDEVLRVSGGKYQMTLTALTLNLYTGSYEIHSAGGLPVMAHEAHGGQVKSIPCRGTPLGTANALIGNVKGQLSPGSRVLLYTDGIPEIEMGNGRQIGMRRFAKLFGETSDISIPLATRRIVETAEVHLARNPQDDDWTFAILQWSGPPPQPRS